MRCGESRPTGKSRKRSERRLWRFSSSRRQRVEKVRQWRPRRSRYGELVQWDTSDHDWLEGRGEEILLINMIDDATSRWFARFVSSDWTVENMNLLESYVNKHGRIAAHKPSEPPTGRIVDHVD